LASDGKKPMDQKVPATDAEPAHALEVANLTHR
jgi:hypothetical protein